MAGAGNLAGAQRADEDVALPLREAVAGVERHAGDGDRRHPVHDRRLEAFVRQDVRTATGPDRCARSSRAASRSWRPA